MGVEEGGFERAAQKLCITQSAVSQRIKQLENLFGQPLLVRTVPPRPTEQGQKLLALLHQVELLEEEWLGNDTGVDTPLLLSLAVNADSLATWLLPALSSVLSDSPIRLNLQVEDETRTQERLRRGEVVGAVIQVAPETDRAALEARIRELTNGIRDEVVRRYYRDEFVERLVLRRLAASRGEPVSRADLIEDLGRGGGDEAENSERAIDVQITRLRRKIEPDPREPRFLQTVRGTGYMLVVD